MFYRTACRNPDRRSYGGLPMTVLQDNAYLKTDNLVVAACFSQCFVHSPYRKYDDDCLLIGFSAYGQVHLQTAGSQSGWYLYPILVHAGVVATISGMSVYGSWPSDRPLVEVLACQGIDEQDLFAWLEAYI